MAPPIVVISDDGTYILIKHIESIKEVNNEDATVDKLRNDISLHIRTISGNEFNISMIDQNAVTKDTVSDVLKMRDFIIKRWINYGDIS